MFIKAPVGRDCSEVNRNDLTRRPPISIQLDSTQRIRCSVRCASLQRPSKFLGISIQHKLSFVRAIQSTWFKNLWEVEIEKEQWARISAILTVKVTRSRRLLSMLDGHLIDSLVFGQSNRSENKSIGRWSKESTAVTRRFDSKLLNEILKWRAYWLGIIFSYSGKPLMHTCQLLPD